MRIREDNYESFVIDWLDGKLHPAVELELLQFLDQHPDIKEEVDGLELAVLTTETTVFPNKDSLRKRSIVAVGEINEQNYENYFIASAEQELTSAENALLKEFLLQNPSLVNDYTAYKKTKLIPENRCYPEKEQLFRTSVAFRSRYKKISFALAAALTIFLLTTFVLSSDDLVVEPIAVVERKEVTEKAILIPPQKDVIAQAQNRQHNLADKKSAPLSASSTEKLQEVEPFIDYSETRVEQPLLLASLDIPTESLMLLPENPDAVGLISQENAENEVAIPNSTVFAQRADRFLDKVRWQLHETLFIVSKGFRVKMVEREMEVREFFAENYPLSKNE